LRATLSNKRIPLEFKAQLIRSVLVPTLHYGAEIFGMNEKRINALKRILDNSLKCIVKHSNFCRLRVYGEFDILPLYVSAAASRARGIKKWTKSHCIVSELISAPH
ncbi:hypothetical protein PAEPH01_2251, partial [Pancytospora epiphaga]